MADRVRFGRVRHAVGAVLLIVVAAGAGTPDTIGGPVEFRPFLPALRSAFSFAESTHSFDVRHYRIDLDLPMNARTFDGRVRMTFTSREPGLDSITLMMDSLVCDSVKRGATRLSFSRPIGYLNVRLDMPIPEGDSAAIDVFYHRSSITENRGFFYHPATSNPAQSYSVAAPYDARWWFPCFDEPFDKAEQGCALNITVPDSFNACANGLLDSVSRDSLAHKRTFHWSHRYPIATYLIVFAASDWYEYDQWYRRGEPDSVIIRTFCWARDSSWVKDNLRNLPDIMAFYCDTTMFGPYPFERYGHVYVTGFQYGGMENQTLTMMALGMVNEATVAHELSHMWWGDMVTCIDYRNVWLNEGFATYWDAMQSEHRSGHVTFNSIMNGRAQSYFGEDRRRRFPTYNPPIEEVYAWGTIYCKGSWIMHMLRYLEDDTVFDRRGMFFRVLRAYGDSFKYRGASTEDFHRIHEQFTGLDLDWFFDEWLYQAGYPQYRLTWSAESIGPDYRVITNLSQDNGANAPAVFHMPVQLKFRKPGQDSLVRLEVETGPQVDTFYLGYRPDSITFDPGRWLLKKVQVVNAIEENVLRPEPELQIPGGRLVRSGAFLSCWLPSPGAVQVFDAAGRCVRTMPLARGAARVALKDLSSGAYLVRLAAGGLAATERLIVLR